MKKFIPAILLAGVLAMSTAQAEQLKFVGEPCPINVTEIGTENAQSTSVNFTELNIAGRTEDGRVIVLYDGVIGYAAQAELEALAGDQLDFASLPEYKVLTTVNKDSSREPAREIQEYLISAGYLDDKADGLYGSRSIKAAKAFQKEAGLEETGEVDLLTQVMLRRSLVEEDPVIEITYPIVYSAEDKFGALNDKTAIDLTQFADPSWKFTYDSFYGIGEIDSGIMLGSYSYDKTAIDRIAMDASFVMRVTDGETEQASVLPALKIKADGAYGAYVSSAILKTNYGLIELGDVTSSREIKDVSVIETAYIPLNREAIAALDGAQSCVLRVNGVNASYDITVDNADLLKQIHDICASCGF